MAMSEDEKFELHGAAFDAQCEAERARDTWPRYHSAHEALGVLLEEVDEFQRIVFQKQQQRDLAAMRNELIQIAAVALRAAAEVCDEEVGRR